MVVTGWHNGAPKETGAGYGLKVKVEDRDRYFNRVWKTVFILMPNGVEAKVNIDKDSFWNGTCRELIKKEIGQWMISNNLVPWKNNCPPKFNLVKIKNKRFKLSLDQMKIPDQVY